MTVGWLAAAVAGRIVSGDPDQVVGNIVTDSRSLQAGDFFIALRGARFDAHEFVEEALRRGALGALVGVGRPFTGRQISEAGREAPPHEPAIVEVAVTTVALQDLAHAVREATETKVIAITGSAGKTTTKDTVSDFLSESYRVVKNKGNLNNHIGLPLSLMQLRDKPDVAVMELGMNHAGEISTLVAIADPDVRVWTNVGDAHLGFFASPDTIADAKAEILESARPSDLLVAGFDDPRIRARVGGFAGRTVTFGVSDRADVSASLVDHRGLDGMAATVKTPHGSVRLETPLLGTGNLLNLLAATAVASELGVPLAAIVERAAHLRPAAHRGELLRLPGGVTLIDDSYNSSPAALKRSLETVRNATGSARKVAVLGEMLELGEHAMRLHEQCGWAAAQSGLDLLIAVGGPPALRLAVAATTAGMPPATVIHVATSAEAADAAQRKVRPGDLVLVKGSRGIRTDVVVERLKAEFA